MPRHVELSLDFFLPYIFAALRILLILLFAWIASRLARRLIRALESYSVRMLMRANDVPDYEVRKRVQTLSTVSGRTFSAIIWALALIMVLYEMNFDVRPLIAGAGVLGVALGFGAQSLVKDILSGFFLLMENQIRINDVAVINGQGGLVEEINLRTTVLRSENGAVHVFPNGSITQLSNLTRDFSYAVFNITVGYEEDTDRVIGEIRSIADGMRAADPFDKMIVADIDMLGVDALAESGVTIKFRLRTLPMKQWMVAREMNARVKKRFAEADIHMPFPTRTIELGAQTVAALQGAPRVQQ
jgi:small-conductance mechanosensitive channel